jgi:predicted transcriptional regulator
MTLTIELPEEIAERLRVAAALEGQEVNAFAIAALAEAAEAAMGEPDPELIAALREGVAELRAGRLLTLEEVDATVEAAIQAAVSAQSNRIGGRA